MHSLGVQNSLSFIGSQPKTIPCPQGQSRNNAGKCVYPPIKAAPGSPKVKVTPQPWNPADFLDNLLTPKKTGSSNNNKPNKPKTTHETNN